MAKRQVDPPRFIVRRISKATIAIRKRRPGSRRLETSDDISILCCPDEFTRPANEVAGLLTAQCETSNTAFDSKAVAATGLPATQPFSIQPIEICGLLLPWLSITHPINGTEMLIPPGTHGWHICPKRQYARRTKRPGQ